MTSNTVVSREDVCWLSLALCILKPVAVEQAFEIIAPDLLTPSKQKNLETSKLMLDYRKLGCSWHQLGLMFNCTGDAVYQRIKRLKTGMEKRSNDPRKQREGA